MSRPKLSWQRFVRETIETLLDGRQVGVLVPTSNAWKQGQWYEQALRHDLGITRLVHKRTRVMALWLDVRPRILADLMQHVPKAVAQLILSITCDVCSWPTRWEVQCSTKLT
jgi:hypothetical protein